MPSVRDKLILNGGGLAAGDCAVAGNADGLQEQFATAGVIAREIADAGLLWHADVSAFTTKLEGICKEADDAQDHYIGKQNKCRLAVRELTDEMRVWLDKRLLPPAP